MARMHAEITRERILDGAVQAVALHGLSKLGMSDVSRSAGVARGTVYRYFASRDELLNALAAREAERFMEEVLATVANTPGGERRLAEVIRFATQKLHEHAALQRLLLTDPGMVLQSLRERFPSIRSRLGKLLAPLFSGVDPVRKGRISSERIADMTTRLLISLYLFEDADPEALARDLIEMYRYLEANDV
jgi:AcrR family transcriptional regulator